jgi:hypothetical protein
MEAGAQQDCSASRDTASNNTSVLSNPEFFFICAHSLSVQGRIGSYSNHALQTALHTFLPIFVPFAAVQQPPGGAGACFPRRVCCIVLPVPAVLRRREKYGRAVKGRAKGETYDGLQRI